MVHSQDALAKHGVFTGGVNRVHAQGALTECIHRMR